MNGSSIVEQEMQNIKEHNVQRWKHWNTHESPKKKAIDSSANKRDALVDLIYRRCGERAVRKNRKQTETNVEMSSKFTYDKQKKAEKFNKLQMGVQRNNCEQMQTTAVRQTLWTYWRLLNFQKRWVYWCCIDVLSV